MYACVDLCLKIHVCRRMFKNPFLYIHKKLTSGKVELYVCVYLFLTCLKFIFYGRQLTFFLKGWPLVPISFIEWVILSSLILKYLLKINCIPAYKWISFCPADVSACTTFHSVIGTAPSPLSHCALKISYFHI